ncbi:hypothetical protein BHM03_00039973 [Ensete ventricosum]|nr:hypothetical protein BHM03_00039973 [Ensete ventricosum]
MSTNMKEGDHYVVNRGEGLTAVDFGSDVNLAEKEWTITLELKRRSSTGQAQQNGWSRSCSWAMKVSIEVSDLDIRTRRTQGPRWQEEEVRRLQQKKQRLLCFCYITEEDAGDNERKGKKLSLDNEGLPPVEER